MVEGCIPPDPKVSGWHWLQYGQMVIMDYWNAEDSAPMDGDPPGQWAADRHWSGARHGHRHQMAVPTLAQFKALIDAAQASRALFTRYAAEHTAKGGMEKAKTNEDAAAALAAAIAPFIPKGADNG